MSLLLTLLEFGYDMSSRGSGTWTLGSQMVALFGKVVGPLDDRPLLVE